MEFSEALDPVFRMISGQSAEVEEKMARMRQAKSQLHREQAAAMNHLKWFTEPDLGAEWQGRRAHQFNAEREKAENQMKIHLIEEVDLYFQQIEAKMSQLQAKLDTLQAVGVTARGIEALAKTSVHGAETLEHQLAALKRGLF